MSQFSWESWAVLPVMAIATMVFDFLLWKGRLPSRYLTMEQQSGNSMGIYVRSATAAVLAPAAFIFAAIFTVSRHEHEIVSKNYLRSLFDTFCWIGLVGLISSFALMLVLFFTGRPKLLVPPPLR